MSCATGGASYVDDKEISCGTWFAPTSDWGEIGLEDDTLFDPDASSDPSEEPRSFFSSTDPDANQESTSYPNPYCEFISFSKIPRSYAFPPQIGESVRF